MHKDMELESMEMKKKEAERDIYGFKEQKLKDSLITEHAKFREMITSSQNYDPWGRPGAGAPISQSEHKKKKFTEYDGFKNDVGVTGLLNNMGIENEGVSKVGHNVSPRDLEQSQHKIENIRQELRMVRAQRAGAQPFEFYDPWGKGVGNPRRGQDGYVKGYPMIKDSDLQHTSTGVGLDLDSKYGGGGGPAMTESGAIKTKRPITLKRDNHGNMSMKEDTGFDPFKPQVKDSDPTYFPFGKPGGGAPIKLDNGRVLPQRRGVDFVKEQDSSADVHKRKQAADEYLVELKREIEEQRKSREIDRSDQRAPFGELAHVVRQGKVGFPKRDPMTGQLTNQHKGTSDVTKQVLGISNRGHYGGVVGQSDKPSDSKEYYEQLTKLAEERYKQRQADRERELHEESQHNENWTELWGRPGGGAPNTREPGFKKHKLDLDYSDLNTSPRSVPRLPKHMSNHENHFQLNEDRTKLHTKAQFEILAPYATS